MNWKNIILTFLCTFLILSGCHGRKSTAIEEKTKGQIDVQNLNYGSHAQKKFKPTENDAEENKKYVNRWKDFPDIVFLEKMPELEEVEIRGNNLLFDISPLATLTGLKKLEMGNNPNIESIKPLSNLTNLLYLNIDYRKPTDGAELANLKQLKVLYLYSTPITSVHYIAGLSELEDLALYMEDEIDISSLGELGKLKRLRLRGNNTNIDLNKLRPLRNLEDISLEGFFNLDVQPLASFPSLLYINFDNSVVRNITVLLESETIKDIARPLMSDNDYLVIGEQFWNRGIGFSPAYDR
ncbi:MAG: hypothetical protein FWG99_09650 [Treponema sp.]|nr:hypothetical protein [Treponema sp.]